MKFLFEREWNYLKLFWVFYQLHRLSGLNRGSKTVEETRYCCPNSTWTSRDVYFNKSGTAHQLRREPQNRNFSWNPAQNLLETKCWECVSRKICTLYNTHTHTHISLSLYIYIYIYHHHHQVALLVWISLTLSLSFSLSIRPYHPSLLGGLPNYICVHTADVNKFLLIDQYWLVHVKGSIEEGHQ